jgi:hypothetical protein
LWVLIVPGPDFRSVVGEKFSFYLKVCFHLLTKGKGRAANLIFQINEAFWFENRRWANRGLPYFHCLFTQNVVATAPRITRIQFCCKGLGRFIKLAVNQTVFK